MRRFQITIIEVDEYSTNKKKCSHTKTIGHADTKKIMAMMEKASQVRKTRNRIKI